MAKMRWRQAIKQSFSCIFLFLFLFFDFIFTRKRKVFRIIKLSKQQQQCGNGINLDDGHHSRSFIIIHTSRESIVVLVYCLHTNAKRNFGPSNFPHWWKLNVVILVRQMHDIKRVFMVYSLSHCSDLNLILAFMTLKSKFFYILR